MADDPTSNRKAVVDKMIREYRASEIRSGNENDIRANIRENVEKLGEDPEAFQRAIRMGLAMTTGERQDFTGSLNFFLGVIDGNEVDLFGQAEIDARNKRAEKRQAKAKAEADKASGKSTDDNPRSDPKKGGAGGASGKGKAKDGSGGKAASGKGRGKPATLKDAVKQSDAAIADSLAEVQAREQEEGAAVLDEHIEAMKGGAAPVENSEENGGEGGAPLSQSAQSARALEKAGLLS